MKLFLSLITILVCSGCAEGLYDNAGDTTGQNVTAKSSGSESDEEHALSCSRVLDEHDPNGVHNMGSEPHFEGWYYRVTDPNTEDSWVIIVAYWLNDSGETSAFIELIHAETGAVYKEVIEGVDLAAIQDQAGTFDINFGGMRFSSEHIAGSFTTEDGAEVTVNIAIDGCARWGAPDDDFNRWTMGWVTEMPGVPLRWHVNHLKAFATGTIETPDGQWIIDDFPIHQEKNWGEAFPKKWMWFQANQFEGRDDVAFAAAVGPVITHRFAPTGYMAGLRINDEFFTWRTQDTHSLERAWFWVNERTNEARWSLVGESHRYRVDVEVWAPLEELIPIDIPTNDGLQPGAVEHLAARMEIRLYEKNLIGWSLMEEITTTAAAVEAGGTYAFDNDLL